MKKAISLLLCICLVGVMLVGCGGKKAAGNTIYVLGPTPDHGWTAQAGTYAEAKVKEIKEAGTYKAVYMPASSGEEQEIGRAHV